MKKGVILFILFQNLVFYGQSPDWSVNANAYQYSMTFTVFLNVNGQSLTSTNDKIGAFVGNENRGEANVVYNQNANKYVAYLIVYSNSIGETIRFKIYDSKNDTIIEALQTQTFQLNGNVGGIFQSFSVSNPALSNVATISDFSFKGITGQTTISSDKITIIISVNEDITKLTPVFSTLNNASVFINRVKQTSGIGQLDFTNSIVFQVLSEDESTLKEYEVQVTKSGNSGELITVNLSSDNISTNLQPAKVKLLASGVITDLTVDDFELQNCLIANITSDNSTLFMLDVVSFNEGSFSVKLNENTVKGQNGQNNLASNSLTLLLDTTKPYVKSIARKSSVDEITRDNEVVFEVVFNEDVVNVTDNDFIKQGNSNLTVSKQTSSVYQVTISNLDSHSGAIRVVFSETNDIQDVSGNNFIISKITSNEK